ncbi:MAG TPA: Calx-beta domain-containing protein [Pirellulales bacterium]
MRIEFLESKALVAGDIVSMGTASLFGVESMLGANAPLAQQLADNAVQVDIHLKITDTNGIAITQIEAGQDFILQAWVQDVRADAAQPGVYAAWTDVTFDSSLVTPDGSLNHGTDYTNGATGDTLTPGLISEAGGFQNSFSPLGSAEHMLFSQQMHVDAAASGNVSFTASPATALPAHDTLTFTPSATVPTSAIAYGSGSLLVIAQPTLTSANVQQAEGNSAGGDSKMTFTVNLTGAPSQTVTVDYGTVDGTAKAGSDYEAASGTLTFNAGETAKSFDVTIHGDDTFEQDEQFSVAFSNASGALAPAAVTGTILNDDTAPKISVNDISVNEGNSDSTAGNFLVSLSNPSYQDVSVDYTFAPVTATAGVDYQAVDGTVTIPAGQTSAPVNVSILGDTVFEGDETFTISLQNPQGGTLDKSTGTATIVDDDAAPTLAINSPAAVTEPTGSATTLEFTVTLTGDTSQQTTVQWSTADNTATAGQDYQAASGQLTFIPGETSKTIDVNILDDNLNEATESFFVNLSSPTGATVPAAGATGTGTILDDGDPAPTVSIAGPATVLEGDSGNTPYTYNVTLSGPSGQSVTVDYATADGTGGVAGTDYVPISGTLTFDPGVTTLPITVNVIGNKIDQDDRAFSVNLSNPHQTSIVDGQALTTIQDDDASPVLSIGDESILEGQSGSKTLTFTATLSQPSARTVTVDYTTADGSATAGSDYETKSGTLTFIAGSTSQTIDVQIDGDTDTEGNETFTVNLSNAVNATPDTLQATGSILNDDGYTITVNEGTATEGDSTGTPMTFTAILSQPATAPLTFDWATVPASGTATSDVDYQSASGTVTFAAGESTATFTVNVIGDTLDENDETFQVNLSNPSYGTFSNDGPVTGTIVDNDAPPTVSITGGSITEGNSGTQTLNFTVNLDNPSGKTVTVDFATADGTATAGSDYAAKTGTVTFQPGQISQTVGVVVNGDTTIEPDETFTVGLSNAANATLGTSQATGTIVDDDNFIISVADTSVQEGNSGQTAMTFTLTLNRPAVGPLQVTYGTEPGTATAAGDQKDFEGAAGFATIADGETSTTVTVEIDGDTTDEPDETLQLLLVNPSYGTVPANPATGTIINDDSPPTMSIAPASAPEGDTSGNPLSFVVTLSQASGKTVTVNYATAGGTATEGTDYTAASGTLTFNPGDTSKTIVVNTFGDTAIEDNEMFTVNLTNVSNATISGDPFATGTIVDDDGTPSISIANASLTEGNSGTSQMTFTATLSKPSTSTVTVQVATADGTAIAGQDYQAANGTLTFNSGETSKQFTITIGGDTLFEADETFTVNMTNATNATIAAPQATGTILNDDAPPQVFVQAAGPTAEGDSGVTPMTFQLFVLSQTGLPVTINYSTADGTATAGSDYQATTGSITFAPGETSKTITVNVLGDTSIESNETFSLNLTAANATFYGSVGATTSVVGTIVDDDAPGSFSGTVYRDTNNNGSMDGNEIPLAGVQVTLSGLDSQGNAIVRTQTTAADGTYSFTNIPKGTFTVTETQPSGYLDGIDTPGTGASKSPGVNDQFLFTMSSGQNITSNNFAERGIVPQAITFGLFLESRL